MESSRTVFRRRQLQFPSRWEVRVEKRTPRSAPSSEPQKDGKQCSSRKSPRGRESVWEVTRKTCRDDLKGKCTEPSCDFWHPPECQNYLKPSWCRFGDKCAVLHQQVEGQPSKKPRKNDDNCTVLLLKKSRRLGCVFQDREPPRSSSI